MTPLLDSLDVEDLVKIALLLVIALLAVKLLSALLGLVVGAVYGGGPLILAVVLALVIWFGYSR